LGRVEFSEEQDACSRFRFELTPQGPLYLICAAHLDKINIAGELTWYLGLSSDGHLLGNSNKSNFAHWVLIAADDVGAMGPALSGEVASQATASRSLPSHEQANRTSSSSMFSGLLGGGNSGGEARSGEYASLSSSDELGGPSEHGGGVPSASAISNPLTEGASVYAPPLRGAPPAYAPSPSAYAESKQNTQQQRMPHGATHGGDAERQLAAAVEKLSMIESGRERERGEYEAIVTNLVERNSLLEEENARLKKLLQQHGIVFDDSSKASSTSSSSSSSSFSSSSGAALVEASPLEAVFSSPFTSSLPPSEQLAHAELLSLSAPALPPPYVSSTTASTTATKNTQAIRLPPPP